MPDATLDLLRDCLQVCRERSQTQGFDIAVGQQAAAVSLLGSILELAEDCLDGLRKGRAISPKILLRGLLEAFVELRNLTNDESYLKSMHYQQLLENRKLHNIATQGRRGADNPYFADLLANETTPDVREALDADIAELEAEGICELRIAERFRLAGEEHRYDSVYRLLTQQSHHNLNALGGRHIAEVDGGPAITFFKQEQRDQILAEADTMAGVATNAVALVAGLIDGEPARMEPIGTALEAFRESMRAEFEAERGAR